MLSAHSKARTGSRSYVNRYVEWTIYFVLWAAQIRQAVLAYMFSDSLNTLMVVRSFLRKFRTERGPLQSILQEASFLSLRYHVFAGGYVQKRQ